MKVALPLLRAALLAAVTGSALQAACPTGADLESGIVTRTADGNTEIHRRTRPDWIQIQVTFDDGDGSILELYHGLYLYALIPVAQGVLQPGGRDTFATLAALQQWEAPRADHAWSNGAEGGGQAVSGSLRNVTIGDCGFDGYDVTITFVGEPVYREVYTVLPGLGIALLVRTEEGAQVDNYSYTSIEPVE